MDRKFINEMKALISWCFEHATVMEDLEFKGFDLDSMYDSLNKELNIKNEFSLQENEIIKKALVEYEENHYEMEDDVWQESINGLISYFNNALYNAFEQQENATEPKIYVAIFNHIGDGYQLLKNYTEVLESKFSKECSVSLVNEDTLCFSGLDGQEISDLMETTGADYNYSYDSAEEAWDEYEKSSSEHNDVECKVKDGYVATNIGNIPVEDYREIVAMQNGFDSYDEMYQQGIRIGKEYDKEPKQISNLMETNGADYNYSYDSPEEAWNVEKNVIHSKIEEALNKYSSGNVDIYVEDNQIFLMYHSRNDSFLISNICDANGISEAEIEKIADSYDIGYVYNNPYQEDLSLKKNKEKHLDARLMLDCDDESFYLTNDYPLGTDYILIVNKEGGDIANLGCNMTTTHMTIEDYMEANLLAGKVQWMSNELHYAYRYNESVMPHEKHCVYIYNEWCEEHGVTLEDIRKEFPETPDVFGELSVDDVIDKAREVQENQISSTAKNKEKVR